jgi:hypothetical protein
MPSTEVKRQSHTDSLGRADGYRRLCLNKAHSGNAGLARQNRIWVYDFADPADMPADASIVADPASTAPTPSQIEEGPQDQVPGFANGSLELKTL